MKFTAMLLVSLFMGFSAFAGVRVYNGTTDLGIASDLRCSSGMTCSKVGGKIQLVSTHNSANTQVAATTTTITAAQCGNTFYNTATATMTLPLASTVIGCSYTFLVLNASNFVVDANAVDQILVLTNAVGDSVTNGTIGGVLILRAAAANKWVVTTTQGTWTDTN